MTATDPPASMLVPMLLLAAATIFFGLDTDLTVGIARRAADTLLASLR